MTLRAFLCTPLAAVAAMLAAAPAWAHPGHGAASDIHWHPSDTYGFIVVAALAGLALWLSKGE
ncbi:hypothetical protein [Ramlibacter sp.]|uniref:hypothetical protein n=1 Tax=Ramlibacter sp. TaxID=1917967 RepID=UPI0017AF73E9|nr:hypothetical protein [Ramlibacter sp.]MBA2672633.1 hypothetical protein [Ramlibacter sp.]